MKYFDDHTANEQETQDHVNPLQKFGQARKRHLFYFIIPISLFSWGQNFSFADTKLTVVTEISTSQTPLQTMDIFSNESSELNPHRVGFWIKRELEVTGFRPKNLGSDVSPRYTVQPANLVARAVIHLRPQGDRWYLPLESFSCSKKPDGYFGDFIGTQFAANKAAEGFTALVNTEAPFLSSKLAKIVEPNSKDALERAQREYYVWRKNLDQVFKNRVLVESRNAEWDHYKTRAQGLSQCQTKLAKPPSSSGSTKSWVNRMDLQQSTYPVSKEKIISRVPTRLWGGAVTMRAGIKIDKTVLSGRFLIDSTAPRSLLSPDFLKIQGLSPELAQLPAEQAVSVRAMHGTGLAMRTLGRKLLPFLLKLSDVDLTWDGYPLDPMGWIQAKTLFFEPPSYLGACCDGVIGLDVLRRFVIEFVPSRSIKDPTALVFYDAASGPRRTQWVWFEVSVTPEGDLVSEELNLKWNISGKVPRKIEIHSFDDLRKASDGAIDATVMRRVQWTLDLPRGRIGFAPDSWIATFPESLRSLHAVMKEKVRNREDVRVLELQKPLKVSEAFALKAGTEIVALAGIPASDLDQGQVDDLSQGLFGETSTIEWIENKVRKSAPISLKR